MPDRAFLVQMAGWMGAGKSTLGRALAPLVHAAILDHDTTKSALLGAGVPHPPAGAASYEVLFALAADLLAGGVAVIIDSPSLYAGVPERGLAAASAAGVPYYFIECACSEALATERLSERSARPSQVADADEAAAVRAGAGRTPWRPAVGALVVDTSRPLSACLEEALTYLAGPGASGPPTSA